MWHFLKHFVIFLSIFYISAIGMGMALGSTIVLDFLVMNNIRSDVTQHSTPLLLLSAGLYMGIFMTTVYYGKILLKLIPFPFEGYIGAKILSIEEFIKLEAFVLVLVIFNWQGVSEIVNELRKRISVF